MLSKLAMFLFIAAIALGLVSTPVFAKEAAKKVEGTALADSMRAVFEVKVSAILKRSCAVSGCHTGKHPEAKLSLDPAGFLKSTKDVPSREIPSLMRVDTDKPEKSYLLMKIRGEAGIKGKRMPRGGTALSSDDIKSVELWLQSLSIAESVNKSANQTVKGGK